VVGTWKRTGNADRWTAVRVLLSSAMPGAYSRIAQVMAMRDRVGEVASATSSHLCAGGGERRGRMP
jgi:hypothetical protein